MLFPTVTFALFFFVVLPTSWILMPTRQRWKIFMLAASYFFYGYWDWHFVFLLAVSTVVNQFFARSIHRTDIESRRRAILFGAVAFNVAILGYFKYADFFIQSSRDVLGTVGVGSGNTLVNVALPVGISFFTFQALSYVIDVYRRDFEPGPLINFATYLSFFPHVVAGPIVRGSEFMPQIEEPKDPRRIDASRAFFLIFIGLFKKVVIANYLATHIVDQVFASPGRHSSLELLVGVYGYAVQIYADFSGYTDMAIGLALLLGFRFPLNFDSPYTATSLQDFWRRWHMTLSRWLRDYLYIPLGGNRGTNKTTYRNLMLTFVIGGLWHGAAWTFVVWGAIHGAVLSIEHWRRSVRTARGLPDLPDTAGRRWRQRIVTFNVVCLAWIFFRAESLTRAIDYLLRMINPANWLDASPQVTFGVILAIVIGVGGQFVPKGFTARLMSGFSRLSPVAMGVVLGVALMGINTLGPRGVAPFIYFRF
ncbi:MAG: MBOAT family protein [Acidimicrobiia bacterium]|jgi:D-alanyl-lipoteichoic acid acyltransferase DltB (MBOAT superfamily)